MAEEEEPVRAEVCLFVVVLDTLLVVAMVSFCKSPATVPVGPVTRCIDLSDERLEAEEDERRL